MNNGNIVYKIHETGKIIKDVWQFELGEDILYYTGNMYKPEKYTIVGFRNTKAGYNFGEYNKCVAIGTVIVGTQNNKAMTKVDEQYEKPTIIAENASDVMWVSMNSIFKSMTMDNCRIDRTVGFEFRTMGDARSALKINLGDYVYDKDMKLIGLIVAFNTFGTFNRIFIECKEGTPTDLGICGITDKLIGWDPDEKHCIVWAREKDLTIVDNKLVLLDKYSKDTPKDDVDNSTFIKERIEYLEGKISIYKKYDELLKEAARFNITIAIKDNDEMFKKLEENEDVKTQ